MVTSKLVEIQKFQTKIAELEKSLNKERQKLLRLPAKLGYGSLRELIAALTAAASSSAGRAVRGVSITKSGKPRRPRTEITPEMKQKVKVLVGEHKTAAEIAKIVDVSIPSISNIKKELGLTRKR